jgi:hypothetical protein
MRTRGRLGLVFGLGAILLIGAVGGCGGGSSGPAATTKAGWSNQHGAAVKAVSTELDLAQATLTAGNQQNIIGDCSLLRDDVTEARKVLPVPDATVDAALRQALDSVDVGAADCVQGGRVASNATLNEKAMAELKTARVKMDAANQALAAWH